VEFGFLWEWFGIGYGIENGYGFERIVLRLDGHLFKVC